MAIRKNNPYHKLLKLALVLTFIIGLAHSLIGCEDVYKHKWDTLVVANGVSYAVMFNDIKYLGTGCIQFNQVDRPGTATACGSYTITPRPR